VGRNDRHTRTRGSWARIRADEYREALAALQQEFDERPDVIDLKRRIDRCEEERRQAIAKAQEQGVTKQGSFRLKVRTRKQRTVSPERGSSARFGAEAFVRCSLSPSVEARLCWASGDGSTTAASRGQGSRCDG